MNESYDSFFRDYYPFICRNVYKYYNRYAVSSQDIEDVSSNILLDIIEQDGLGKFDPDRNVKIKTYIASYVFLLSRRYSSLSFGYYSNNVLVDSFPIFESGYHNEFSETGLYDQLRSRLDSDALTFLEYADTSQNYTIARKHLSDLGWEKKRITAAVKSVRYHTKQLVGK